MRVSQSIQAKYEELIRRCREVTTLSSCSELLSWDEETYMPPGGVEHRGRQLALLAGLRHELISSARVGELLEALEGSSLTEEPDTAAAANIREIRKFHDRRRKIPRELLEEIVQVSTIATREWSAAYKTSDFPRFLPWLERLVALKRREAEALEREGELYDALLEDYEPGARSVKLEQVFASLRRELVPLVEKIAGVRRQPDLSILERAFPVDRQRAFSRLVAEQLGFDFTSGRIDETVHPFCARIGPGDSRIATRYSATQFSQGLFAVIHEVGHAFYEQGLDPEQAGTPAGDTASLGVHESQSRLWENLVGRSQAFWTHFFPRAQETFGSVLKGVTLDAFHFAINRVGPTFVRAEADEVTYNLHVLVRFDLERALINGSLEPADLRGAWNERYRSYLGIEPPDDHSGCLQDGHWGSGLFGYFPTYTLGNMFSAQLYAKAVEDCGDFSARFARGDFGDLLGWLRQNVHRRGRIFNADRLIEVVTGKPPSHKPLIAMLKTKYEALYGV